ncbi:MAG: hypothetical protein DWQ42_21860 [Planctomycetota bacterium]|nr:MAG: hypothetical protein DWQ42_21860 [Planctomycetota bacterium]REK46746.1 MAG: hypothetical protein DWQ46_05970 [Planctomycetota bacterium]
MTKPIPVDVFPIQKTYGSFGDAIEGANKHPRQKQAKRDSERLSDTSFVDARWSDRDFVLQFSNGMHLHVYVQAPDVLWQLSEAPPDVDTPHGVGSTPSILRWGGDIGDLMMDCSSLIEKRRGAHFWQLFVNETGFFVYLHSQLILSFTALRRTDSNRCILHVCEEV